MKNKILYIFIFLFVILFTSFLFSGKVAALTFPSYDGKSTIDVPEFDVAYKSKYYLVSGYESAYTLLTNDFPFFIRLNDDGGFTIFSTKNEKHGLENCYWLYYTVSTGKITTYYDGMSSNSNGGFYRSSNAKIVFSNFDILTEDDELYFSNSSYTKPFINNWDEIKTGLFDNIFVYTGNKYGVDDNISLSVYEGVPFFADDGELIEYASRTQKKEILNSDSPYLSDYFVSSELGGMYIIPRSVFFDLKNNYQYEFKLSVGDEVFFDEVFVMGEISAEQQDKYEKDKQLALQEEQNKTSKGIWDSLKEVLSYLNPFSENFFVYKLIELLIEGLKSLFIPGENFFTDWLQDLNDYFSETLGILYYPFDLLIDFFTRIGEIDESKTAVISWPNFEFMGANLIKAGSYDLYSLINDNDTFKTIHGIYLTFTDIILWIGVIFLGSNCLRTIFGGMTGDIVDGLTGNENRKIYKKEHDKK